MTAFYTPDLVTLPYVKQHRKMTATTDDALLTALIREASAEFATACQRTFMPYTQTKMFGAGHLHNSLDLDLRDDLLAVTSLTNGDGGSITADYALRPDNAYPKTRIELASASGANWRIVYREDRISVAGIWGYVPHYTTTAWRSITTTAEELDASETGVDLTSGTLVEVGGYLLIDSEQMYVTAVSSNTATVERGANGTTAATHSNGATVKQFVQGADVKFAVREAVVYAYLTKDQIGGRVQVFDGGVVQVSDLDPRVADIVKRLSRKHPVRAV